MPFDLAIAELGRDTITGAQYNCGSCGCRYAGPEPAILNLHEHIKNKLFLDRTRKDSNFKRPHICATLFQIEKCWS
jgi:hypothetical protein